MRVGRAVELSAWILGIALLGFHGAARLSFERARVAGIEAFREASVLQPVSQSASAVAEPAVSRAIPVDQSLWSEQRVTAFTARVVNAGPPEGVLTIPSLQLEVPVYSGTSQMNLNRGAGHIEGTAPLSDVGNIGIAAHRDGFFRKLKDIAIDDEVRLEVRSRTLRYRVVDISVVAFDVCVLGAFGAMKLQSDPLVVSVAAVAIAAVFGFQRIYLGGWTELRGNSHAAHKAGGS